MSFLAWLIVIFVVAVVIAVLVHLWKWSDKRAENFFEQHIVTQGVKKLTRHYYGSWRKELRNHKYFSWFWKIFFAVTDNIVIRLVTWLCRVVAFIAKPIGNGAMIIWSKAIAAKDNFADWRQRKADEKIDRAIARAEAIDQTAENASGKIDKEVVKDIRGRFQKAQEEEADQKEKDPVPNLIADTENSAKNDQPASDESDELPEDYGINSSVIEKHFDEFFSKDQNGDSANSTTSEPAEDVGSSNAQATASDEIKIVSEDTVRNAAGEQRELLEMAFQAIGAGSLISIDQFAEQCRPITADENNSQPEKATENQGQEVLETIEAIATDETATQTPADQIGANEVVADAAAIKENPEPETESAPIASQEEKAPELKAVIAEINPPKTAKNANPSVKRIDQDIEKLLEKIEKPKRKLSKEEKVNFFKKLKELLDLKAKLGKSPQARTAAQEAVISMLAAEAAHNYNQAALLEADTITKEDENLKKIPALLKSKMTVHKLKLDYARQIEDLYKTKKTTSELF